MRHGRPDGTLVFNGGIGRVMRRGVAVMSLVVATSAVSAPAQAQFFFDSWGGTFSQRVGPGEEPRGYRDDAPLRRAEIRGLLARRGYTVQPPIERNGDVYIADTIDQRGRSARLIVDAYDGSILERFAGVPPRPAVGLRNEELPSAAPRFGDDPFDRADRFDEQRSTGEVRAPRRLEDIDERLARRPPEELDGGDRRVIEAPRSARPESNRRSAARGEPGAVETRPLAAPEPRSAPVPPTVETPGPEASKPENAKPAQATRPAKPAVDAARPAEVSKPQPSARPAPPPPARPAETKSVETRQTEAKPEPKADAKPATAPRVIPLFKVPEDQRAAAAEDKTN